MDKVIKLAKQAGAVSYTNRHYPDRPYRTFGPEELQKFYTLARADLEAELLEQARIVGMGGERELKLMAENARLQRQVAQLKQVETLGEAMFNVQLRTDLDAALAENAKLRLGLEDAATSLETIGRLAGKAAYLGDDGERIPTYMEYHDEVRGYAKSRASVARAALGEK